MNICLIWLFLSWKGSCSGVCDRNCRFGRTDRCLVGCDLIEQSSLVVVIMNSVGLFD